MRDDFDRGFELGYGAPPDNGFSRDLDITQAVWLRSDADVLRARLTADTTQPIPAVTEPTTGRHGSGETATMAERVKLGYGVGKEYIGRHRESWLNDITASWYSSEIAGGVA